MTGMWRHGTASGYSHGCRLSCCRSAHREASRRYRTAHTKGIGRPVDPALEIEYAIARGVPASKIMERFAITYRMYRNLVDGLDAEAADRPVTVDAADQVMVGGRPLSSYYGPAAPEALAELVDAIMPRRMKDAAGRFRSGVPQPGHLRNKETAA